MHMAQLPVPVLTEPTLSVQNTKQDGVWQVRRSVLPQPMLHDRSLRTAQSSVRACSRMMVNMQRHGCKRVCRTPLDASDRHTSVLVVTGTCFVSKSAGFPSRHGRSGRSALGAIDWRGGRVVRRGAARTGDARAHTLWLFSGDRTGRRRPLDGRVQERPEPIHKAAAARQGCMHIAVESQPARQIDR